MPDMFNSRGLPNLFLRPHPHAHPHPSYYPYSFIPPSPPPVVFEPEQTHTQSTSGPQHTARVLVWFLDS